MPAKPHATASGPPVGENLDGVLPVVYAELCVIARRQLSRHGGAQTLSTGGLVHEAYLKLAQKAGIGWHNRAHLLALCSLVMRQILVDRAKARLTDKRGGSRRQVTLEDSVIPAADQAELLLDVHDALTRLAAVEPRLAELVDCRFFGGLSESEIADARGVTTRTVQRDWAKARMLLRRALVS